MATARYTCEEAFTRLNDYLDRELSEQEMQLVSEHLDTCASCAGEHNFEAAVIREVKQRLVRIDVPEMLALRISERLREAESDRRAGG
jgi:mycothiol system anti-sigma-R factor